jgi:hypothetical protein
LSDGVRVVPKQPLPALDHLERATLVADDTPDGEHAKADLDEVLEAPARHVHVRARRVELLDERADARAQHRARGRLPVETGERGGHQADRRHRHDLRDLVHEQPRERLRLREAVGVGQGAEIEGALLEVSGE